VPAVPKPTIHTHILRALGNAAEEHGDLDEVPFRVRLHGLGDFDLYTFTLTSPPGGRPVGEYKVQLIVPGQARGQRGQLDFAPGVFTILVGWSPDEDVFVLWDAYAHSSFAYSQNLQVKGETIWSAQAKGVSAHKRLLRGRGVETVVACRSERLLEGIRNRISLSAHRLGDETDKL
jgi:hypothetical protein